MIMGFPCRMDATTAAVMEESFDSLLERAQAVYRQHFPMECCFERAVFFSWGCTIGDCQFCYMSNQPADKKPLETKRSRASIFAEFLLAKKCGWDIGFFTGGIGVFTPDEIEFMLRVAHEITCERIWLSIGPVPKSLLVRYQPYIRGIVGSTETVNPKLHAKVCPSKPLAPYERMFVDAACLGLQKAMTFIVGLGETRDDVQILIDFIRKYRIDKIHVYGLIPVAGTLYEGACIPTAEEQAWWIAQLRVAFPSLDIQCGIWSNRADRIPLLLKAGANSISKLQAVKLFGTETAKEMVGRCEEAGRRFRGTLTALPEADWDAEVARLSIDDSLKVEVKRKLWVYLKGMRKQGNTSPL